MYSVYIIRSRRTGRYHVDTTSTINEKLDDHNRGKVKRTQTGFPWELVHRESFTSWEDAVAKEKLISSIGIGRYLRSIGKI
jgi:putative endonuclease